MDELFVCNCGRLAFEVTFPLGATRDHGAEKRASKGDRRRSVGEVILVCRNCSERVKLYSDDMGGVFLEKPGDLKK